MGHFQEAWQVYQRMLQNGIAPRRGVILLLLNKAIEDHDLPRVLELLAVLKDKHHSISPDKSQKILQKAAQEGEKWRSVVWEVMEIYRNCLEPLTQEVSDEIINWLKRYSIFEFDGFFLISVIQGLGAMLCQASDCYRVMRVGPLMIMY